MHKIKSYHNYKIIFLKCTVFTSIKSTEEGASALIAGELMKPETEYVQISKDNMTVRD